MKKWQRRIPQLEILNQLHNQIVDEKMAELNFMVDDGGMTEDAVAREFLSELGLVNPADRSHRSIFVFYVFIKCFPAESAHIPTQFFPHSLLLPAGISSAAGSQWHPFHTLADQ